jgi:predicted TIM-barrel fold metal-dependent hydrolase
MRDSLAPDNLLVVDADTHFSEPWDLWTSRATAKYRDRVPQVHIDPAINRPAWYVEGDRRLLAAGGGSVINRDGTKEPFWDIDIVAGKIASDMHPGSFEVEPRLDVMDEQGVWAQVVYPNAIGFAAGKILQLPDRELSTTIVRIYNDALAEWQAASGRRLLPQAMVPFWDMDALLAELDRIVYELDLTGITMSGEPFNGGLPDLADPHWDPFYEAITDLGLPINIHVGSGGGSIDTYFSKVWPSQDKHRRYVLGCIQLELANSNFLSNLVTSDVLVRWPELKFVSVESGIGWIPYVLERADFQLREFEIDDAGLDRPPAIDLFHQSVYACFWFEKSAPRHLLDTLGADNVMFESDFPHPTCLYPNPVEHALRQLEDQDDEVVRKVMGGNAAKLYSITRPAVV